MLVSWCCNTAEEIRLLLPYLQEQIVGTWEWVRAEGGIANIVQTPETAGFTRRLIISPPNQVELLRDGVTEVATTFDFLPSQDPVDESMPARLRYAVPILGFGEQTVGFDVEGRLVLLDPCCDGFRYTWSQVR